MLIEKIEKLQLSISELINQHNQLSMQVQSMHFNSEDEKQKVET
jgi:FtsZ-binding cell division protein ZapB